MKLFAFGLVTLVAIVGCTPSHVEVRPQSSELLVSKDDDVLAAYVRVPETGAGGLDVRVWSTGASRHKHKKETSVSIAVDLEVENRSESTPAAFDPHDAILDAGLRRNLEPISPVASDAATGSGEVTLEPGAKRTFHLKFWTAATDDPRDLMPFTLRLPFKYGFDRVAATVHFERDRPPSYYYGGYPGYYGYWGYPGYYGGYWGPGMGYGGYGWGWGW